MTQINSPFLLSKLRPISELSRTENNYREQLERILQQMYRRLGGSNDSVQELELGELYEPGIQTSNADELIEGLEVSAEMQIIGDLLERVEDLENSANSVDVSIKNLETFALGAGDTALTTTGDQFIPCVNTAAAVITLNLQPEDGEDAIIWRGNAQVTVSGAINGGTSIVIRQRYDAPHFKYSLDAGEWAIV